MAARKRKYIENLLVENAKIRYVNFSGAKQRYNREGDRNFVLILDWEDGERLRDLGWNIKFVPEKDEREAFAQMKVKVSYARKPPEVTQVRGRKRIKLDEDTIGILDSLDIENIDLEINPSVWTDPDGNEIVSAYLKTAWVVVRQDPFAHKYEIEDDDVFA